MFSISDFLKRDAHGEWSVVPDESTVSFDNQAMWGLSTVRGRFTAFSGHGRVSESGEVSGELDIDAGSLDTGNRMRDRHLRSGDFFRVERFPQIKVVVTNVVAVSENALSVDTHFTVTGTTKPVSLRAEVNRRDDGTVTMSAGATVDRTDLGVYSNKFGMVGKRTNVHADLVFRRVEG